MKNTLRGELYMDEEGKPHFICHTPPGMEFEEARDGLEKFVELLQGKIDHQNECPYFRDSA